MDWGTIFGWLAIVGVGGLVVGFLAKYLGLETIWNFFKGIFDTILDVVKSVVLWMPAPIRILVAVIIFSMLAQPFVDYTFGLTKACYDDVVYDSDLPGVMTVRFMSGLKNSGTDTTDYFLYRNETKGILFPIEKRGDLSTFQGSFGFNARRFVEGKLNVFSYEICYDEDNSHNSSCYIAERCDDKILTNERDLGRVSYIRDEQTGLVYVDTAKMRTVPANAREDDYNLNKLCNQSHVDDRGVESLYICVAKAELGTDSFECGYVNLAFFETLEWLANYSQTEDADVEPVEDLDVVVQNMDSTEIQEALSGVLTTPHIKEDGDLITYTCKNDNLTPLVIGLPIFEPWFLFVLIFIGVLMYISNWMRGY